MILNDEQILKAINDGRKANKRDGRDGILVKVASEYMQDKRYCLKAQDQLTRKAVKEEIKKGLEKLESVSRADLDMRFAVFRDDWQTFWGETE